LPSFVLFSVFYFLFYHHRLRWWCITVLLDLSLANWDCLTTPLLLYCWLIEFQIQNCAIKCLSIVIRFKNIFSKDSYRIFIGYILFFYSTIHQNVIHQFLISSISLFLSLCVSKSAVCSFSLLSSSSLSRFHFGYININVVYQNPYLTF
jgi:hypothetical protein